MFIGLWYYKNVHSDKKEFVSLAHLNVREQQCNFKLHKSKHRLVEKARLMRYAPGIRRLII